MGKTNFVLLISIDSLRKDHIGYYGYRRNTTPFMDYLALEGKAYKKAFSPIPLTMPAHTSIFTSRYPCWNRVSLDNRIQFPMSSNWIYNLNNSKVLTAAFLDNSIIDRANTPFFDFKHYDNNSLKLDKDTIQKFIYWVSRHTDENNIFCFLHLTGTTGPYDIYDPMTSKFVKTKYDENPMKLCNNFLPDCIPYKYNLDKLPDFPGNHYGNYYIDKYDGCLSYVDSQINKVVNFLKSIELQCLTIIITSSHGESLGENGYWCCHSHGVVENQTQIPFILWSNNSDIKPNLVDSDAPISLIDIGPTVMHVFGLSLEKFERLHGWSLYEKSHKWSSRTLFSISPTQILSYDEKKRNGVVIGKISGKITNTPVIDANCQAQYFNIDSKIDLEVLSKGILFYALSKKFCTDKILIVTEDIFDDKALSSLEPVDRIENKTSISAIKTDKIYTICHKAIKFPGLKGNFLFDLNKFAENDLVAELQIHQALELGCGPKKHIGFIGLDRFPLKGVDVVSDLDSTLGLANDSFDLILAVHSLEHVEDIMHTMEEVYRICRHGAHVCIVAPYHFTGMNLANPYHKQVFNEHTPRFWTANQKTSISQAEFHGSHASNWALGESDCSSLNIDFRCVNIEFFYYPKYKDLSVDQKRDARKKYLDVCDQIMYQLIVVKQPMNEDEMVKVSKNINVYEPPYITALKHQEHARGIGIKLEKIQKELEICQETYLKIQNSNNILTNKNGRLTDENDKLTNENDKLTNENDKLTNENDRLTNELSIKNYETKKILTDLETNRKMSETVSYELDFYRHRRITNFVNRFFNRSNAVKDISNNFQQIVDDSYIFNPYLKNYVLQPSINLKRVKFLEYNINMERDNLCGVLLAIIPDFPILKGIIGIEIESIEGDIVAKSTIKANQVNVLEPVRFEFPVIKNSDKKINLKVFSQDLDNSLRIFEWRYFPWHGIAPVKKKIFCGYLFA